MYSGHLKCLGSVLENKAKFLQTCSDKMKMSFKVFMLIYSLNSIS